MQRPVFAIATGLALVLSATQSQAEDQKPWPAEARPVIRFIEAWNQGDYAAIPVLFAPDASLSYRGRVVVKGDGSAALEVVKHWRTAFPDFRFTIEDVIVQGDEAALRLTFTGTHTGGPFWGAAPTGKPIKVDEMLICRVEGDKIGQCWETFDEYGMRLQLGPIQPPAPKPGATK
jgi:predicted ester cyclase